MRAARSADWDLLAPGLYAWAVTVAWPASQRFAPLGCRIFALIGVVALVAGTALTVSSPQLGRVVGIWIFVGSCLGAWALLENKISPSRLDPVQGVLGSVGWGLYAISWAGKRAMPRSAAAGAPAINPVRPRQKITVKGTIVLTLITAAAAVPMILAWWVESIERSLLAHAIGLAAAIALVTISVDVVDPRAPAAEARRPEPQKRVATAAPALTLAATLVLLGAAYALLR